MTDEANGSGIPERYRPDPVERVAGGLPVAAAAGALAAFAGTPLAALLPVLAQTLAAGRQQARISQALQAINQDLEALRARLDELTDQQYQVLSSAVGAVFETIDARKLEYLRRVARNALGADHMATQEAVALGRMIRDISADEAAFLLAHFGQSYIHVDTTPAMFAEGVVEVRPESQEALIVHGLHLLGLLQNVDSIYEGTNGFSFSRIAAKLIVLLRG